MQNDTSPMNFVWFLREYIFIPEDLLKWCFYNDQQLFTGINLTKKFLWFFCFDAMYLYLSAKLSLPQYFVHHSVHFWLLQSPYLQQDHPKVIPRDVNHRNWGRRLRLLLRKMLVIQKNYYYYHYYPSIFLYV